jgi:cell migration-inducing and hyaluronan-binding protein
MDNGSWVVFELPGFTTAAAGAQQSSLAALRDARDTSYYKNGDTLWVKLVVANAGGGGGRGGPGGFGGGTSIDVSR